MRLYSPFFQTLYDETGPTGQIGRGTHYSVLRAVVFDRLSTTKFCDFALIWDEDHDTRVIEVIERLYFANLLAPFLFLGERKGTFNAVLASHAQLAPHQQQVFERIAESSEGDSWSSNVGSIDGDPGHIIQDDDQNTKLYLANIKMLWRLGLKEVNVHLGVREPTEVVHSYEIWDQAKGDLTRPVGVKSTAEAIERRGGRIVGGTAETVPVSRLNGVGQYRPGAT